VSPEATGSREGITVGRPGEWPDGFVRTQADRDAMLALTHLVTMVPSELHALAWRQGTARRCLEAVLRGRAGTATDRAITAGVDASQVRAVLDRAGVRTACPGDDEYPAMLLDLPDPPGCLFLRGSSTVRWPPAVAMVGARACTPYGWEVAASLAASLAAAGLVVVSGAARGIDTAAHRGALDGGGQTVAVLGSGIDVPYPKANRALLEEIADRGVVLSEYPPGSPAVPRRFPARNRIVAALSVGVVVVEGAEGSGSLITAEFAQDLGREVMAVPGPVNGPLSAAPNQLIRDGASLVTSADDVFDSLGMVGRLDGTPTSSTHLSPPSPALDPDAKLMLSRVPGSPVTLDALASSAGMDPAAALRTLAALELHGLVREEGGRYRRTRDRETARSGAPARRPRRAGG
jgi:DNA processing protein